MNDAKPTDAAVSGFEPLDPELLVALGRAGRESERTLRLAVEQADRFVRALRQRARSATTAEPVHSGGNGNGHGHAGSPGASAVSLRP